MKLADYLASKDLNDAAFAEMLGCDRSTVSRLRRADTKPSWGQAERIREITGGLVTPNDFLDAAAPVTTEDAGAAA